MSIAKTSSWSNWSASVNESISFQDAITQEATNTTNQLNTLQQEFSSGVLNSFAYQIQVDTLQGSVIDFINNLPNQFPNLQNDPDYIDAVNNLKSMFPNN